MLQLRLKALLDLTAFPCLHKLLILDTLRFAAAQNTKDPGGIYSRHLGEQLSLFASVDDDFSHQSCFGGVVLLLC